MKFILCLLIIFPFSNCNYRKKSIPTSEKIVTIDAAVKGEPREIKFDTIIKVTKPFELNGSLCYWENHIVYVEENIASQIDINLKYHKTKQTLLEASLGIEDSIDYKSDEYFNTLNNEHFQDFNFDGFKDFYFYSRGSMAMTSSTAIYLFNSQTKLFEFSEYLSAISIEGLDKKNRTLSTYSFDRDFEVNKTHHFDKSGKVKYTEVITKYWNPSEYMKYEKIVDGEVVETKKDSVLTKEK